MTKELRTNVEFVVELMEHSAHGGLIQGVRAARARAVRAQGRDGRSGCAGHQLRQWAGMHGCAVEVRDKLAQRLGEGELGTDPGNRRRLSKTNRN